MYRSPAGDSDPPHPPFKLAWGSLPGTVQEVIALPHVQVGAPIEHKGAKYVPLGRAITSPVTAQKALCWVKVTPGVGELPSTVGTAHNVPYTTCPTMSGPVVGGSPEFPPTGGALSQVHPSSYMTIYPGAIEGSPRPGGFYVDMLSTKIGSIVLTTPLGFHMPEIVVYNPQTQEVAWSKKGWTEDELIREQYDSLMWVGKNLFVWCERYEYENISIPQIDTDGVAATSTFLAQRDPQDLDEDGHGDSYSETGLGWGNLAYWLEDSTNMSTLVIGHHPEELFEVTDRIKTYLESIPIANNMTKVAVKRTLSQRLYAGLTGELVEEKATPYRGPCVKDNNGNPIKHNNVITDSYRVEHYDLSGGLDSWEDWPGFDPDLDEFLVRIFANITIFNMDNELVAGSSGFTAFPLEVAYPDGDPGFPIAPFPTQVGDTYGEVRIYALIRRKRRVTCEVSKRKRYRTYHLSSNGSLICNAPGMRASHAQTLLTDNPFRDRETEGGGGGGGGGEGG